MEVRMAFCQLWSSSAQLLCSASLLADAPSPPHGNATPNARSTNDIVPLVDPSIAPNAEECASSYSPTRGPTQDSVSTSLELFCVATHPRCSALDAAVAVADAQPMPSRCPGVPSPASQQRISDQTQSSRLPSLALRSQEGELGSLTAAAQLQTSRPFRGSCSPVPHNSNGSKDVGRESQMKSKSVPETSLRQHTFSWSTQFSNSDAKLFTATHLFSCDGDSQDGINSVRSSTATPRPPISPCKSSLMFTNKRVSPSTPSPRHLNSKASTAAANPHRPLLPPSQHLLMVGVLYLTQATTKLHQHWAALDKFILSGGSHRCTDTAKHNAGKVLCAALKTWRRLQGCLPSTRLSDYLLGGVGHGSDAAVALASELLRQVEDLYLLCESEPDLRDLPADPEAARQARLCRLFGETPERMQARFDLLRSCSLRVGHCFSTDVEDVLQALQHVAPPMCLLHNACLDGYFPQIFSRRSFHRVAADPLHAGPSLMVESFSSDYFIAPAHGWDPGEERSAAEVSPATPTLRSSNLPNDLSAAARETAAAAYGSAAHTAITPVVVVKIHYTASQSSLVLVENVNETPISVEGKSGSDAFIASAATQPAPLHPNSSTGVFMSLNSTASGAFDLPSAMHTLSAEPHEAGGSPKNTEQSAGLNLPGVNVAEVQSLNLSAQWFLDLREGEGLSRFRFFAPVEGGSGDTEEACGSVAWFHAIAAALPQQDGPAAAVEWLRAHAGLDEVLVTRHPGDEKEDLLAAVARCANLSYVSPTDLTPGIPCISAPLVLQDVALGAFYGIRLITDSTPPLPTIVKDCAYVAIVMEHLLCRGQRFHSPHPSSHQDTGLFVSQPVSRSPQPPSRPPDMNSSQASNSLVKRLVKNSRRKTTSMARKKKEGEQQPSSTSREGAEEGTNSEHTVISTPLDHPEHNPKDALTGPFLTPLVITSTERPGEVAEPAASASSPIEGKDSPEYHQSPTRRGATAAPAFASDSGQGVASCPVLSGSWAMQRPGKVLWVEGEHAPTMSAEELSNALPKKENSASHSTGGKNTSQQPSEEGGKSPPQIFPWNESGGVGATQRGAARRKSSCFSFFRDAHSRSSITASARQLTLLHEINSVRMGLLHQRLTPGNPISSICIADDVPPVIYIHDMLLQQVINSFFTNDSRRRGSWSTVSSMYHAFVNVCEMYIVVDLLRADNVPGEDPGELYIQRLQKFYIDCEAQYQELFTPAPAKVISDRVWRDELAGRPRWIDGVLLRAERLFRPLESPTAELVSDKASGENLKHSYSSPPEWQRRPVRSHSILPLNSISSPMDLSPTGAESDMNMGATPLHPERLPEVWAVQDAACAGPKAVVDLAADFLEPVRQLLAEIGGVVVATSAGTASIVLPYITQDRLDLLKEWRIVTRPFSAMAEMGIAAVNQLADEALIRKAYEEKEVGQTAPILNLHYEAAAEPFQELLGKDIHIPSIEEVNKAYAAAESLALEQSGVASGNTSSTQLTPAQSHFEKRAESAVSVRTTQDHRAGLVKIQPVLGLPLSLSSSGQNPNTSPAEKSATAAVSPRMPFMFKGGAAFEDAPGGISETQTFRSRMAADTSSSSAESPLLPPPFNDKMSTTPEDVIRSLTGLLSSSKLESDDAVVLPSAETEISAAEAEDNHITVEEDSNKSFIDFAALPPSKRGYVSRVDAPNFRILILNAEPCIMLLKWLIDLDHSVSFAVNTQHIRGFLLGGISVYDVVLIEWTASVMTPENMELLERVRQDNFAIPIFYCYTGPDVTPDITTPVGLSNRPHLPPDIHADHILYGKDLLECCVSRRSFIRSQIRLGRLLKDLRGDTTITYQITRRIGSGGFGDVYEVSLYASKGRLAMKRIPLGNVTLDRMDQLYKEVVIMRELDHRSIIHFSHITCDKTCLNIFMELCQCSLEDILAEGFQFAGTELRHAGTQAISGCEFVSAQSSPKQLHHNSQKTTASSEFYGNNNNNMRSGSRSKLMHRPSTVVTPHAIEPTLIIRDVVSAVKYLHCFDIVHRDIKPQNILFLDGVAKLADFGSATTASKSQESLKTMKGTVPYMAPEVFLGEAYRKSCDIWSLGILFAELFGLHLAHFSLLHFPALQDFYKSIDFDESMPVVATNYVDIGFKKHFPDEFVEKVKEILEEARRVSAEERRLRFVEQETVRHSTSSQDSSQSPSIVSERTRTIFVVEVNTQDLNCTASQHQLPASLIELLEHTFHRCPGKRITAEQLLEHPMANKSEWLQKMFVEVEELNRCICAVAGTHDAAEEEKHLDLSFGSQSGDGGSGDDSW